MSDSIKLSPKHGLNPSVETCAWCGGTKGIALMGRLKGDAEAPKCITMNYEPCDDCAEKWKMGIVAIEVSNHPLSEGQPPMDENAYPTGRYVVIKREAMERMIADDALRERILKHGKMFMAPDTFEMLFGAQL